MSDKINVSTGSADNKRMSEVTGTDVGGGKTAIDVNIGGSSATVSSAITSIDLPNTSSNSTDITRTSVAQSVGDDKQAVDVNIAKSVTLSTVQGFDSIAVQDNGTATTTPANIPLTSAQDIYTFLIRNTNTTDVNLQVSIDGSTYFDVEFGDSLSVAMREGQGTISVQTASGTCTYQAIFFMEPPP